MARSFFCPFRKQPPTLCRPAAGRLRETAAIHRGFPTSWPWMQYENAPMAPRARAPGSAPHEYATHPASCACGCRPVSHSGCKNPLLAGRRFIRSQQFRAGRQFECRRGRRYIGGKRASLGTAALRAMAHLHGLQCPGNTKPYAAAQATSCIHGSSCFAARPERAALPGDYGRGHICKSFVFNTEGQ